jgi:hypothetical protein
MSRMLEALDSVEKLRNQNEHFKEKIEDLGRRLREIEEDKDLVEKNLSKAQLDFERQYLDTDLPNSVRRREAYLYRNLMSKWFSALIGKFRYDESVASKQIRADWLEYLRLLEHEADLIYWRGETDSEEKARRYDQEIQETRSRCVRIEEAFAAKIGQGATEQLQKVRDRKESAFDRLGNNMAPIGYRYRIDDELTRDAFL